MRQTFKIPTIIAVPLLLAIIFAVSVIFENFSRGYTQASSSTFPRDVQFTNIYEKGFTLTWFTQDPATGAVIIEKPDKKSLTLFDERDLDNSQTNSAKKHGKYTSHSVTFRSALPSTSYRVKIISSGKTYLKQGAPYRVQTAAALNDLGSGIEPAFGNILTSANQPADGAIIFLTLEGSQTLSTLAKSSGSWLIPLNLIRTDNLESFLNSQNRLTENISVRFDGQETIAVTDTLNDAPVPTMVLGRSYDFRKIQAAAPPAGGPTPSLPAKFLTSSAGRPGVLGQNTAYFFDINQPNQKAVLTANQPLFAGTGIPGQLVTMTLGITNPQSGTTIVDADGLWKFTPNKPLAPGKQSVTATSVNNLGKPTALTRIFTVLKSGTQVLGEATPSATLTPSATPTLTLTPTTTPYPTATPTGEPALITTGEPLPTSGSVFPTLLLILLGLGLMLGGGFVYIR